MDKIKKNKNSNDEDFQVVYGQISKNKQQIQLFYSKNKAKLPPILQSRNYIFKHLQSHQKNKQSQTSTLQSKNSIDTKTKNIQTSEIKQKNAGNICKIVFQKSKRRQNRTLSPVLERQRETMIQMISRTPRKFYISEQNTNKLKFLNGQIKNTTLQKFLEQLNQTNRVKNTFYLSKSVQKQNKIKQKQPDVLLINKISAHSPEDIIIQQFKTKSKLTEQIDNEHRIFLKNSLLEKNRKFIKRRQISRRQGNFEPWGHQYIQEQQQFCISGKK